MLQNRNRYLYFLFWTLSVSFIILSLLSGITYLRNSQSLINQSKSKIISKTQKVSNDIQAKLEGIQALAVSLATSISDSGHNINSIKELLQKTIYMDADLYEIGIAFAPFVLNPDVRLMGIAYSVADGSIREKDLDAKFDYTRPEYKWYYYVINNRPGWSQPIWEPSENTILNTYSIPFTFQKTSQNIKGPHGVLYLTFSSAILLPFLQSLELGENGYSYILSSDGHFIAHPRKEYMNEMTNLFELSDEEISIQEKKWYIKVLEGKFISGNFYNTETKQRSWVYFQPIHAIDWLLGAVLVYEDTMLPSEIKRKRLNHTGLFLLLSLALMLVPLLRVFEGTETRLWTYIACFTLLTLIAIVFVLFVYYHTPDYGNQIHTNVTTHLALKRFILGYDTAALQHRDELPLYVPTGIYIQSMSFVDANDVRLTGYIWQKYYQGIHDNISRGFILPESESLEIMESYKNKNGNEELLGWKFRVVLHQKFDYTRYPFGMENVWVQLWHKDFYRNVILIPDLDSYMLTSPRAKPGLRKGLEFPGWIIDKTFFSYWKHTYKTNFGLNDYSGLIHFPELYFNTLIRKEIIGPFVTHILPIGVIFSMLFTILLLTSKEEKKIGIFGFNTLAVVGVCGGFFLVVIFSHIDLRESLAAKGFIFLEYFYFITYSAILYVALNAFLIARTNLKFICAGENRLVKMAFWPISQLIMLTFTLLTFY